MPFHPHKEAAIIDVGVQNAPRQGYQQALDSEVELRRVLGTVQHVRSSIYQTLDQVRCHNSARHCAWHPPLYNGRAWHNPWCNGLPALATGSAARLLTTVSNSSSQQ
jgi:hypothetical protein